MCEMVECLSRRTWLTDDQLSAILGTFSDEVGTRPVGFRVADSSVIRKAPVVRGHPL